MHRRLLALLLVAGLAGCGGGSKSSGTAPVPTSSGGGSPATPSIVQVTAGQTASGVSLSVAAPSGTAPNAQDLGVAALSGPASAFNTGDIIHRGATMRVVMFGAGLGAGMTVSILGANDLQISNVAGITATDGTPGVSFTLVAASNAALGARTVVLKTANGNMTAFAGGLEVVP